MNENADGDAQRLHTDYAGRQQHDHRQSNRIVGSIERIEKIKQILAAMITIFKDARMVHGRVKCLQQRANSLQKMKLYITVLYSNPYTCTPLKNRVLFRTRCGHVLPY